MKTVSNAFFVVFDDQGDVTTRSNIALNNPLRGLIGFISGILEGAELGSI